MTRNAPAARVPGVTVYGATPEQATLKAKARALRVIAEETVPALFKRRMIFKPKGLSLHLLRHTMASQMLDGSVPLPVVSQRLGHSCVKATAGIYSHAIHGQDDEAVPRWEEYQKRNRPAKPENWKGDVQ